MLVLVLAISVLCYSPFLLVFGDAAHDSIVYTQDQLLVLRPTTPLTAARPGIPCEL